MRYTFARHERLKSRKAIAALFKGGASFVAYPLRVVWLPALPDTPDEGISPAQVAIAVPKRTFKTAVARNRIKRLIREAYRLHKHNFYAKIPENQCIVLMLTYIGKELPSLSEVERGVLKVIKKFPVIGP